MIHYTVVFQDEGKNKAICVHVNGLNALKTSRIPGTSWVKSGQSFETSLGGAVA